TEAPSQPSGADEEAAPLADAEEEPDADDPEGEGTEEPSATEQPAGESGSEAPEGDTPETEAPEGDAPETEAPEGADADGDTPASLTVEGSGGAPLVAPNLAAVPVAQGPVQIGGLQARIANQTSDGSDPCLTYAPEARGDRTAWVTNPDEAQAGHSGPVWVGGFFGHYECPTAVDTSDQSVAGIRPSTVTSVTPGTSFLLGQTTHYNNPIDSSAGSNING